MTHTTTDDGAPFEAGQRRLCPDGACVGVLDQAGRCKVCGRMAEGVEAMVPATFDAVPSASPPSADGGFDPTRRLCFDGACLGIVGTDGRCSVCGRSEPA